MPEFGDWPYRHRYSAGNAFFFENALQENGFEVGFFEDSIVACRRKRSNEVAGGLARQALHTPAQARVSGSNIKILSIRRPLPRSHPA